MKNIFQDAQNSNVSSFSFSNELHVFVSRLLQGGGGEGG